MSVCRNDTQKVSLPIRDLEVLEEAFSWESGVKGHKNRIVMVGRRRRVVGTLRSALVAHWGEERICNPFAGKWLP